MFGFCVSQFQLARQFLGEVVTADWNVTQPQFHAIGHDQIGGVGSHRQDDHGIRQAVHIDFAFRQVFHHFVADHVLCCQGGELNDVNFDVLFQERLQGGVNGISLDRKQTDFGVHDHVVHFRTAHALPIPDHIFDGEWNLLTNFVFHNFRQSPGINRWRLEES